MLQFGNRRGLLKVVEGIRVVVDIGAVALKGPRGQQVHRLFPCRIESAGEVRVATAAGTQVGPRDGIERGRDHQLEIALGQDHVAVLKVENLALFGDAELAVEAVEGLGVDGAVRGPTAAADRAAAPVKEPQMDVALARHLMQGTVRLPNLPGGGDHAAILVGVGVAEHDLLLASPAFKQGLVCLRGPEFPANFRRVLQVLNRFKKRCNQQSRVVLRALRRDASQAREPQRAQHVFRTGGTGDDVLADALRIARALDHGDRAEGVDDLGGHRRGR